MMQFNILLSCSYVLNINLQDFVWKSMSLCKFAVDNNFALLYDSLGGDSNHDSPYKIEWSMPLISCKTFGHQHSP